MGFFVIFYPASRNQAEKFIYQFFKAQVTGTSFFFGEYTFLHFLEKTSFGRNLEIRVSVLPADFFALFVNNRIHRKKSDPPFF